METEGVRIERGLIEAALAETKASAHSVPSQITYWARLGRAFESTRVPGSAIGSVLAKQGDFDSLSDEDQLAVIAMWEHNMAERISNLDLVAEFEAAGQAYAFLNDAGNVVVVRPGVPQGSGSEDCER